MITVSKLVGYLLVGPQPAIVTVTSRVMDGFTRTVNLAAPAAIEDTAETSDSGKIILVEFDLADA